MKRSSIVGGIIIILLATGVLWVSRGLVRDWADKIQAPSLPEPVAYLPNTESVIPATTGKTPDRPATPPKKGPVIPLPASPSTPPVVELPAEVNLAVPFLSQAPKQNWDMPFQEACEEASLIMTDAYFGGRTKPFGPEEGERAILDLVAYEEKAGFSVDISAREAAEVTSGYFQKRKARVIPRPTIEEAKRLLAKGIPLILPADGKALKNPNFRNGGPPYHMLVLKGYLADGRWITNDPGTRKGANYIYDQDLLWDAIHDWNNGMVPSGNRVVIIMEPVK